MKNRQLPGSLFTINSFKCDSSNSRSVSLISRIPQHKAFNDCKTWLGWIIAGFGPLAAEVFAADFNDCNRLCATFLQLLIIIPL